MVATGNTVTQIIDNRKFRREALTKSSKIYGKDDDKFGLVV
jgi:hypothetical protein